MSQVNIIHRRAFPLSRQLDEDGGEMVMKRLQAAGVTFMGNSAISRILETDNIVTGVELLNGTHIPADLVVFAIGVTPRDDLAREAGIRCASNGGIIVDDNLETDAENIFAIGECASWKVIISICSVVQKIGFRLCNYRAIVTA